MEHRGEQFGTDCFKLWECGAIDLPAFAGRIVDAANLLVNVEDVSIGGGPGTQKVMSAWTQLGVSLRDAMTASITNVYHTCDAVIDIAARYADQDDAARISFGGWRDYEKNKHVGDHPPTLFDDPSTRPQVHGQI